MQLQEVQQETTGTFSSSKVKDSEVKLGKGNYFADLYFKG